MFEKFSAEVRKIFDLKYSNNLRCEMFEKFRIDIFENISDQKVRKNFDQDRFKKIRPEMFEKNSTRMFQILSSRNIRKKIDVECSKNLGPMCSKIFRSKTFEKISTQEDEKFSTQGSRKNSKQEWRVMHIPSFFSSIVSSVQFKWFLIDCIPHVYYLYIQAEKLRYKLNT